MSPIRKRTRCAITGEMTMCVSYDGGNTFYSNRAIGIARRREKMGLNPLTGSPINTSTDSQAEAEEKPKKKKTTKKKSSSKSKSETNDKKANKSKPKSN